MKDISEWIKRYCANSEEAALVSDMSALQHSIKKWKEGLSKEILSEYGLNIFHGHVHESDSLLSYKIKADSCALCHRFSRWGKDAREIINIDIWLCMDCPLSKVLGGVPCDHELDSPYKVFWHNNDPQPMVDALEKALEI